jgi:hypothetical protein
VANGWDTVEKLSGSSVQPFTQLRFEILDHGLPPQREFDPEERPDTSA